MRAYVIKNKIAKQHFIVAVLFAGLISGIIFIYTATVHAVTPTAPSFELVFSPKTGAGTDATGDGGGGSDPYRYNEYYVGQNFTITVRLLAGSSRVNGADVQFDIPNGFLDCTLDPSIKPLSGAITMRTFSDPSSSDSPNLAVGSTRYWIINSGTTNTEFVTGTRDFARLNCKVLKKRENMLGTASPLHIKWYYQPGSTLDTNIAEASTANDIIASPPEDAYIYLWPDTGKPYIDSFNPVNLANGVSVTEGIRFNFNDKNLISGDETGVNKSSLRGSYRRNSDSIDINGAISWGTCSGVWSNNTCIGTFNPPTRIGGNRNYSYNTEYRVCLTDGADLAHASQNPPDAAPNIMDGSACTTFTTETDTSKPAIRVGSYSPTGNSADVESDISFVVQDVKGSTSTYGTGVDPATVKVNIQGKKQGNVDFELNLSCADAGVICTPQGDVLEEGRYYAYEVTIDPSNLADGAAFDTFAQNETVTVRVTAAADYAGNIMDDFAWDFTTRDTTPPEIINIKPNPDSFYSDTTNNDGNITFEVIDSGVGVAQGDIRVRIGDGIYQYGGSNSDRIIFTGDANHWFVTISPLQPLDSADSPNAITIDAQDQVGNALDRPILFAVAPTANDDGYDQGYAAGLEEGYGDNYTPGKTNGWQDGYDAARSEFYEQRYQEGYAAGLAAAGDGDYNTGYKEGYEVGSKDGYVDGKKDGLSEGYDSGYLVGFNEGKNSVSCNCSGGSSSISYPSWGIISQQQVTDDNSDSADSSRLPQFISNTPYSLQSGSQGAVNQSAPRFKQLYWLFPILAIACFSGMMQFAYKLKILKETYEGVKSA